MRSSCSRPAIGSGPSTCHCRATLSTPPWSLRAPRCSCSRVRCDRSGQPGSARAEPNAAVRQRARPPAGSGLPVSWKAHQWAKSWTGELTSPEAFVLLIIADHFNEKELRAWPAIDTILTVTRLKRATVFAALQRLEELGLVQVENRWGTGGRQRSNRYCLPFYDPRSTPMQAGTESGRQAPRLPSEVRKALYGRVRKVDPEGPGPGPGSGPGPGPTGPPPGPKREEPLGTTTSEPLPEPLGASA